MPSTDSGYRDETTYAYGEDWRDVPVDEDREWYATRFATDAFFTRHLKVGFWDVAPGEESFLNYHVDPIREFYYVLDGELVVRLKDDEADREDVVTLGSGGVVYLPPGIKHQVRNRTDRTTHLLSFSGPPVAHYAVEAFPDEGTL